jgi:hypothetical protein
MARKLPAYMTEILLGKGVKNETNKQFVCNVKILLIKLQTTGKKTFSKQYKTIKKLSLKLRFIKHSSCT